MSSRGRSAPSARSRTIPSTGWPGSSGPPPSAPTGNYPATPTPPTRSAPNPPPLPPTCGRPGTRRWRPSAPSTGPTSAACPTGGCCTCATPTPSKPAGRRSGPARNCGRSGSAPPKPASPPSAPAAEAGTAHRHGQHDTASQQQALAASYQAMHDAYREREAVFAAVMADRQDWEQATRRQRQLAVAADTELRRRHPGQQFPPLRSAEPEPATQAQRDELTLTAGEEIPQLGQWIADLAAQHRAFTSQAGRTAEPADPRRRPRLRRPRPGVPRLDRPGQGRDPPAAQAPDPAVATDPGTRRRPRSGHGSCRMTPLSRQPVSPGMDANRAPASHTPHYLSTGAALSR